MWWSINVANYCFRIAVLCLLSLVSKMDTIRHPIKKGKPTKRNTIEVFFKYFLIILKMIKALLFSEV